MTSATPETPDASPGLRPSLEAILLVADEPVPLVVLAQVLERPRNEVEAELRDLAASYVAEGRGFDLREIAGGWRFYTREDCAPLVERFVSDGQEVRLTQAALETLAVVAYPAGKPGPGVGGARGQLRRGHAHASAAWPYRGGGDGLRNRRHPVPDHRILPGAAGPGQPGGSA